MRRPVTFSAFHNRLWATAAGVLALTVVASCSDSTGPNQGMPDGVHSVDMFVPDSLKLAVLTQIEGSSTLNAPTGASEDILTVPVAGRNSFVVGGGYSVSTKLPFSPDAIPDIVIPQDSVKDDGYLEHVPLQFAFNFYGVEYTEVNVYSNGFLTFGPGVKDPTGLGFFKGGPIPNVKLPNNVIAFAWTDWQPNKVAGAIRYQTRGSAPNRRFILQFTNVPEYTKFGTPKGYLMAQVVLAEGTNTVTIYTNTMSFTTLGQLVTQGIENADGTRAAW